MEDDLNEYSKEELIEHIKILNHNIDIDEEDKCKNYISKDKIKEKLEVITKEYYKLFDKKMSLECMNINGHRYNAMKLVLEELLGE